MTQMKWKYPLEYEVTPAEVDKGTSWLTLKLKNIGAETIKDLDVELHSLDTYNLTVYGSWGFGAGQYLYDLEPSKEKELIFRVNAVGSADVFATIKGRKDGGYFWWESGWTHIRLSEEKAGIERLLVLSHPYSTIGSTISVEATVKGKQKGSGLNLEFWVETPSGKSEKQASIDLKDLPVGEESRYTAEFTPKETGGYTVYAYLYDGWRRVGYKMGYVYIQKK